MSEAPILRPAARVILIDANGRILLFCHRFAPDDAIWATPGGALEGDETHEAAALRELWEETGLRVDALGPWVWSRAHVFPWGGRLFDQRERYFVLKLLDALEVTTDNWEDAEREEMVDYRWWSLDEIAASAEVFVPQDLARLLIPILAGDYPPEPFDVGI